MALSYHLGDITTSTADAIVNAANSGLARGGGVCGAIFAAADRVSKGSTLAAECSRLAPCPTGGSATTNAYGLTAKHIIHAVGPVWSKSNLTGSTLNERGLADLQLLERTYHSIFVEMAKIGAKSIAIPAISTGIFGLPKDLGAGVAYHVCSQFEDQYEVELWAFSPGDLAIMKGAQP